MTSVIIQDTNETIIKHQCYLFEKLVLVVATNARPIKGNPNFGMLHLEVRNQRSGIQNARRGNLNL